LKNSIIINAPSFWPSFLISQRILWPNLGAVKRVAFDEDFMDQDFYNILISRQGGKASLDP
jgi:hypothetical protein